MKTFEWTSRDGDSLLTANSSSEIYTVHDLKGFSEPPEFNQITQQGPYQHGSTATRTFARPRAITFKLVMRGDSLANLEATRRYVGRSLSGLSAQDLPNEGTLKVTGEDDVVYSISAVPTGVDYQTGIPSRGPRHQKANIYLTAYDPWWRVDPANEADLTSGETTTISNFGDIPVFPEWTLDGPVEEPKLENLTTGQFLEFDSTLASGWRLEVGHKVGRKYARAVEIADEDNIVNWMPFLTPESIWWNLLVGPNDIELSSIAIDSSGDPGGEGTLTWSTLLQSVPI